MNDITVPNPRLTFNALLCPENEAVFSPFLKEPKILELSRVSLKWMKKEKMLKQQKAINSKLRQIFLIPNFEDEELFNHLFSQKHSIWGPSIIAHCFAESNPLPIKYRILYSMAFEGITVSFTGLSPEVKVIQGKRVELMGGKVSPDFSMAVDVLIAKDCEATPKYRAAFCWNKPICHFTVIDAIWEGGSKHVSKRVNKDRNDFAMELLTDCVVCVSGIKLDERSTIGKAIEENGGKYTMEMERGVCTHLITDKLDGDKYKFALQWGGIRIVTTRWLRKSLDRKMRLPEDYYHPDPALRKQDEPTGNTQKDAVFPSTDRKPIVQPKSRVPFTPSLPAFVASTPVELYRPPTVSTAFPESNATSLFSEKPAKMHTLNEEDEDEPIQTEENEEDDDIEITFIVPSAGFAHDNIKSEPERTFISHGQDQESDHEGTFINQSQRSGQVKVETERTFISQVQGQEQESDHEHESIPITQDKQNVPVKIEPERTFISQVQDQESDHERTFVSQGKRSVPIKVEPERTFIPQDQQIEQVDEPISIKKERVTMIGQIGNTSAHEESTQIDDVSAVHEKVQTAEPKSIKKERVTMIADVSGAHEESTQVDNTSDHDDSKNAEPVSIKKERVTMIGQIGDTSAHEESTQMSGISAAHDNFQNAEPISIKKERVTMVADVSAREESNQMSVDNEVNVKPEPEQSTVIDPIGANSVQEEFTQLSINAEEVTEAEPMDETTLASISNAEAQLDELVNETNLIVRTAINNEVDSTHELPEDLPQSVDQEEPVVSNLEQPKTLAYQVFSHVAFTQIVVPNRDEPMVEVLDQMTTQMEVDQVCEEPIINEEIPKTSDQTRKTATFAKSASTVEKLDASKAVDFDQAGDSKARKKNEIAPSLNDTIVLDDSIIEIKHEVEDSFEERKNRSKPKQLRPVKKGTSSSRSGRNKSDDLQAQETLPSVPAPIRSDLLPDEVRHCYRPSMFVSMPPAEEKDKKK